MLNLPGGRRVMDDPDRFPASLLPFARAHAREVQALRRPEPALDWLIAIPPANLSEQDVTESSHRLSAPVVSPEQLTSRLTYGQLASAVADQVMSPTHNREQVAVLSAP